jgi:gliding motility-associated-like protein
MIYNFYSYAYKYIIILFWGLIISIPLAAKEPQSIIFPTISDKSCLDSSFTLSATATSGLPVTFSLVSGAATLEGNKVTILGQGVILIVASQQGNDNFEPASEVYQTVLIPFAIIEIKNAINSNPRWFVRKPVYCVNDSLYIQISLSLGPEFQYAWTNDNKIITTDKSLLIPKIESIKPDSFMFSISKGVCKNVFQYSVKVNIKDSVPVEFIDFPKTWDLGGEPIELEANPNGGIFYKDGNPLSTLIPTVLGMNIIHYKTKDSNGCRTSGYDTVLVKKVTPKLKIFELISPNDDTKNDFFWIENITETEPNDVTVFNTWGQAVFTSKNYKNDWSPKHLPDGTYTYLINHSFAEKPLTGNILIVR